MLRVGCLRCPSLGPCPGVSAVALGPDAPATGCRLGGRAEFGLVGPGLPAPPNQISGVAV
eukprot:12883033-Alexandrium_andersonii.AAC.1